MSLVVAPLLNCIRLAFPTVTTAIMRLRFVQVLLLLTSSVFASIDKFHARSPEHQAQVSDYAKRQATSSDTTNDPCAAFTITATSTITTSPSATTQAVDQSSVAAITEFQTSAFTTTIEPTFDGAATEFVTVSQTSTQIVEQDAPQRSTVFVEESVTTTLPPITSTSYVVQGLNNRKRAIEARDTTSAVPQLFTSDGQVCHVNTRVIARVGNLTCTLSTVTSTITASAGNAALAATVTSITTQTSTINLVTVVGKNSTAISPTTRRLSVFTTEVSNITSTIYNLEPVTITNTAVSFASVDFFPQPVSKQADQDSSGLNINASPNHCRCFRILATCLLKRSLQGQRPLGIYPWQQSSRKLL